MKIHTVQLNLEDFDNGTSDMSALEFAIYTRLFLASYTRDLPDDDEKLSRIARCKVSEIKKCRKIIDVKFYKSENFLKNNRAEKERERYKKISEKNKKNAHERWKIEDSPMPTASNSHCDLHNNRNAIAMLPNTQHLIPNNRVIKTPPTPPQEKSEIPENLREELGNAQPIGNFLGFSKQGFDRKGFGDGKGKDSLTDDERQAKNFASNSFINNLSSAARKRAQENSPGWSLEYLAGVYIAGIEKRGIPEKGYNAAFPAWCFNYTKGKCP